MGSQGHVSSICWRVGPNSCAWWHPIIPESQAVTGPHISIMNNHWPSQAIICHHYQSCSMTCSHHVTCVVPRACCITLLVGSTHFFCAWWHPITPESQPVTGHHFQSLAITSHHLPSLSVMLNPLQSQRVLWGPQGILDH